MSAPELGALRHPYRLDGIDVSAVQGAIDWRRVAEAGFRFVIVKVSEGTRYCDPRALEHIEGARAAGLRTSVYAFLRPSQGRPVEQVERLWECLGDTMPAFRPVLDLEGAPDSMSGQDICAFGDACADAVEALFGRSPFLYTYPSFAHDRLGPALARSRLGRCPLWMASYYSTKTPWAPTPLMKPPVPQPWPTWTIWQYSGDGGYRVPGVPGDCDRNLFNGDEAAFRRACGLVDPDAETRPDVTAYVESDVGSSRREATTDAVVDAVRDIIAQRNS